MAHRGYSSASSPNTWIPGFRALLVLSHHVTKLGEIHGEDIRYPFVVFYFMFSRSQKNLYKALVHLLYSSRSRSRLLEDKQDQNLLERYHFDLSSQKFKLPDATKQERTEILKINLPTMTLNGYGFSVLPIKMRYDFQPFHHIDISSVRPLAL